MDSSFFRKIEKAKDYSVQEGRVVLMQFQATFRGDNSDHEISYEGGRWSCNCHYFAKYGTCSHTMAMEMMLRGMVGEPAGVGERV